MKRIKREKQVVKVRIRNDCTDLGDLKILLLSLVIPHLLIIKGIPKPIFDIPLVSTHWLRFGFCVKLTLQSFLLKFCAHSSSPYEEAVIPISMVLII